MPGSALQIVAARQGTLGHLGRGPELAATLDRWTRHILTGLAVVAVMFQHGHQSTALAQLWPELKHWD